MKRNINSTDIAKLAGVSRSTVSKVINNYQDIPEETRDRVLNVIKDTGYQPNIFAKILKGIPQTAIALYIYAYEIDLEYNNMSGLDSPYVMGIVSNFIKAAKKYNHKLYIELLESSDNEKEIEARISQDFDSKIISSAVFLGLPENILFINRLIDKNYRIGLIDYEIKERNNAFSILTDERKGCIDVLDKMKNLDNVDVCFIGGKDNKRSARIRLETCKNYALMNDLKFSHIDGFFSEQTGISAAKKILEIPMLERPNAFLFSSDTVGHGFIKIMKENDPEYLAKIILCGFDNSPFDSLQIPALSSLSHDFGAIAEHTLVELLAPKPKNKIVPLTLICRESLGLISDL